MPMLPLSAKLHRASPPRRNDCLHLLARRFALLAGSPIFRAVVWASAVLIVPALTRRPTRGAVVVLSAFWSCAWQRPSRILAQLVPGCYRPRCLAEELCRTGSVHGERCSLMSRWPWSAFTMSNSAVFFVPSAARWLRPVLVSILSHQPTMGGADADRRNDFSCVALRTRQVRASEARRVP